MKIIASEKKINPGIYDLSIDDYHRGPGISRSGLMEFKRSLYHYWYKYLNPDYQPEPPTPAQILGNALHTYLLEPNEFNKRYFVIPKFNKVTKEGKARWETIKAEIGNKQTLSSNQYQVLQAMVESFNKHELASQFLEKAKVEQSIYWTDKETKVLCKCRPDILHPSVVVDLKTTQNGSVQSFSKTIYDYGYHIQEAMIREALQKVKKIEVQSFWFIVIEKTAPYVVSTYKLAIEALEKGKEDFKHLLKCYQICLKTNHWQLIWLKKFCYLIMLSIRRNNMLAPMNNTNVLPQSWGRCHELCASDCKK